MWPRSVGLGPILLPPQPNSNSNSNNGNNNNPNGATEPGANEDVTKKASQDSYKSGTEMIGTTPRGLQLCERTFGFAGEPGSDVFNILIRQSDVDRYVAHNQQRMLNTKSEKYLLTVSLNFHLFNTQYVRPIDISSDAAVVSSRGDIAVEVVGYTQLTILERDAIISFDVDVTNDVNLMSSREMMMQPNNEVKHKIEVRVNRGAEPDLSPFSWFSFVPDETGICSVPIAPRYPVTGMIPTMFSTTGSTTFTSSDFSQNVMQSQQQQQQLGQMPSINNNAGNSNEALYFASDQTAATISFASVPPDLYHTLFQVKLEVLRLDSSPSSSVIEGVSGLITNDPTVDFVQGTLPNGQQPTQLYLQRFTPTNPAMTATPRAPDGLTGTIGSWHNRVAPSNGMMNPMYIMLRWTASPEVPFLSGDSSAAGRPTGAGGPAENLNNYFYRLTIDWLVDSEVTRQSYGINDETGYPNSYNAAVNSDLSTSPVVARGGGITRGEEERIGFFSFLLFVLVAYCGISAVYRYTQQGRRNFPEMFPHHQEVGTVYVISKYYLSKGKDWMFSHLGNSFIDSVNSDRPAAHSPGRGESTETISIVTGPVQSSSSSDGAAHHRIPIVTADRGSAGSGSYGSSTI